MCILKLKFDLIDINLYNLPLLIHLLYVLYRASIRHARDYSYRKRVLLLLYIVSEKKMPKKYKKSSSTRLSLDQYFCMEQNAGQLERRRNIFSRKQR